MRILEEIGLTKTESNIYRLLLQLGGCSVGTLQKSSGSHPQIVYRAIDSLINKGLVICISKKNKKYVSAEHPKKLEQIEKEKLEKLKDNIPELINLMTPPKNTLVKTSIGIEAIQAFRRRAIDELKKNDTLMIIGGSGDRFYNVMGDKYNEIEEKRIKKKINKKLIAFPSEKEKLENDKNRLYSEFRFFNSHNPTTSSINIFKDNIGIIIWTTEPILIHIKDKDIALSYKNYFNEMWANTI